MPDSLAHRVTPGTGPTILFLPGYASDMSGTKALALDAWAQRAGARFVRFDYRGCGESPGRFADFTLADWRDDALAMLDAHAGGPAVLVGSSMGGWLALMIARDHPERVAALVGVAAAPDFTEWGFTAEEKATLARADRLEQPNPYGPAPTLYTHALWQSGEANKVLGGTIDFDGPVRLLHGMADPDVPWRLAATVAERVRSADVQVWLTKDGDHRLSREADLAMLIRAVEDVRSRA